MYIEPNTMIDPNRINGQFYENMNFTGDEFMGYSNAEYMNYANVSETLKSTLTGIHNSIEEKKKEVVSCKEELLAVEAKQTINASEMLRIGQKVADLEKETEVMNKIKTISEEGYEDFLKWKLKLDRAKGEKSENRSEYMFLNGEVSRLNTCIQSREMGSIYGLEQEFKAKAGFDYTPPPEAEVIVDPVVNNSGGGNIPNNGFINNIGNTTGLDPKMVKYGLIGIAVLGGIYLIKKRK